MNNDDIEELLQQYGENLRQQKKAADHVRQMTRNEARLLRTAACLLLLVAVGVYYFRAPHSAEPLMAEMESTLNPQPIVCNPQPATPVQSQPIASQQMAPKQATTPKHSRTAVLFPDTTTTATLNSQFTELAATAPEEPQPVPTDTFLLAPQYDIYPTPTADLTADNSNLMICSTTAADHTPQRTPRLRFTAGIGAAVAAGSMAGSPDLTGIMLNSRFTEDELTVNSFSPTSELSAHAGMSYALVQGEHSTLDVGLGLGGYTHQYTMVQHLSGLSEGAQDILLQASVQSLFINLPLTLHTHRTNKTGWQFSLTPARQVLTTQAFGPAALNPWRLTLGIGMSLPYNWIHAITLTADMLPAYLNVNMYQFGISIDY